MKSHTFIRSLMTTVCESAITGRLCTLLPYLIDVIVVLVSLEFFAYLETSSLPAKA